MFNKLCSFFKPGKKYKRSVTDYYSFLIDDFNYTLDEKSLTIGWSDGYYDIKFKKIDKVISIYYELMEYYYNIHFTDFLKKGHPQIDFWSKRSGLNYFIKTIYPFLAENDFIQNDLYFEKFDPTTEMERKLLEQAKDLRLCLLNLDKMNDELN